MQHDPVNSAQRLLIDGQGNLMEVLPVVIKRIILDEAWVGRKKGPADNGEPFKSFQEFAEYKLWWGLECPYDRLMRYCEHDEECRELLEEQGKKRTQVLQRAKKAKELRDQGMTQQQIADELGVTQRTISGYLEKKIGYIPKNSKPPKRIQYLVTEYTKPETAAEKIRAKFGTDFALQLKEAL